MPEYDTPEPISVTIDLGVATVTITASDRTDTVVGVRPSNPDDESDLKAARQVDVAYANGTLQVKGPKVRPFDFSRKTRSVEVSIALPSGSHVSGDLQTGDLSCAGRLGECRLKTSAGHIRLERTGPLRLSTSAGHVTAGDVAGNAEIHTGSGRVSVGGVAGSAEVTNSNGDIEIGSVAAGLLARTANGDITVERAAADVEAKTANGGIRLGEVARGSVALATAMGDLQVGIAEGTAAWLELDTGFGKVRNELRDATGPGDADETVEVRARTSYGDITIRRS